MNKAVKFFIRILFVLIISGFMIAPSWASSRYDFVVAKDGTGDFSAVQEAINAVPHLRKERTFICIKNGIYREKIILPSTKINVSMIGESVEGTAISWDDYASKPNIFGEEMGTSGSSGFFVYGDGFYARNITFANTAGPVGQAVAVRIDGDMVMFENCRFLGNQDTLTPESSPFGFVFIRCRITGDAPPDSFYLGRPWRPYSNVVFIGCEMGSHIRPEGWHNWNKPEAEKTAYYAEYRSTGEGADPSCRVPWSHQLTDEEAAKYDPVRILGDWILGMSIKR